MDTRSIIRVIFNPGGSQWVALDWGDITEDPELPWSQDVERPAFPGANAKDVIARGNVSRDFTVKRRQSFAGETRPAEAMHAAIFAADASRPKGITAGLRVLVLDLTAPSTGTESERTSAGYAATQAALVSARYRINKPSVAIDWTYTFAVNEFTVEP